LHSSIERCVARGEIVPIGAASIQPEIETLAIFDQAENPHSTRQQMRAEEARSEVADCKLARCLSTLDWLFQLDAGGVQHVSQLQVQLVVLERARIGVRDADSHGLGRLMGIRRQQGHHLHLRDVVEVQRQRFSYLREQFIQRIGVLRRVAFFTLDDRRSFLTVTSSNAARCIEYEIESLLA